MKNKPLGRDPVEAGWEHELKEKTANERTMRPNLHP